MLGMGSVGGICRTGRLFARVWATLSVLLVLGSTGYLGSLSRAQTAVSCGVTRSTTSASTTTTLIRVEDATGVDALREALNCTAASSSGEAVVIVVEAAWVGRILVNAPIEVAEGTRLSVTGEGSSAEVHGGHQTRLFQVSPSGALILTGLKLSGGSADIGGAIHSHFANLTFDDCVFDGNINTDGNGGAVWARGGIVTILGGAFLGNKATQYGGALHVYDGELIIRGGAKFESNQALVGGGALFCGLSEVGSNTPPALCSIADAEFLSNRAYLEDEDVNDDEGDDYDGSASATSFGGAAMFMHATVDITDSLFSGNFAQGDGGALEGSLEANMVISGCTFGNNTAERYGGAVSALFMTLGGGTQLVNNSASEGGGAVVGWDEGVITFNDVSCRSNWAGSDGGCFITNSKSIINDGTIMHDNVATYGGCIYASEGSAITVDGGNFTCQSTGNGAFLFAADGSRVNITGGLIESNVADSRGGAVYCSGDSSGAGGSRVRIEGGTFTNNSALELGGAIVAWGSPTVVTITGGVFSYNAAKFYGGFVFLEEEASITCEGATITGNYAGEQGGGIYARQAEWVNSSCDFIANESPQGAAIYLTNVKSAMFENHTVANNVASGGSVVYVTESAVGARAVTFESDIGLQEDSFNRAVQLDGDTTLTAEGCVFRGWLGDTVIYHKSAVPGSLILDSCEFSDSSAAMAVISPNSDAEIRNAIVGSSMFKSGETLSNSLRLVDRALDCSDSNACGAGGCVNSTLGVLCECLENGECLDDGGDLSLHLKTAPAAETFSPDTVSYELMVSSGSDGTTYAIWDVAFEADDLTLDVVPSSGVLSPGDNVNITVIGTPMTQDVGGTLSSKFAVTSLGTLGNTSSGVTGGGTSLEVNSTFYLCSTYEYAMPLADKDTGVVCEQCVTIEGGQGVNCESMGATLVSLPIRQGYWRSSQESVVVKRCFNSKACKGGTKISSSDDYCKHGYKGPYCAVCIEGYGRSLNNCHSCQGTVAQLLIVACALFSLTMILLLLLASVFLIGGLDAVNLVRQSMIRKSSRVVKACRCWYPARERTTSEQTDSGIKGARINSIDRVNPTGGISPPGFGSPLRVKHDGGEGGTGYDPRLTLQRFDNNGPGITCIRPLGGRVGAVTGVERSSVTGRHASSGINASLGRRAPSSHDEPKPIGRNTRQPTVSGVGIPAAVDSGNVGAVAGVEHSSVTGRHASSGCDEDNPVSRHTRHLAVSGVGVPVVAVNDWGLEAADAGGGGGGGVKYKCGVLGEKIKCWALRVPLEKLKVLVVVWQILAVFSGITSVEFPPSYSLFLSWINILNFDLGYIVSASCVLPSANFYHRLLATTLAPFVVAAGLAWTYRAAKRRAGIGSAGVVARAAAWSRHVAAGLLLTFLVFTSTSSAVFNTFPCDEFAVDGESYLRADYGISCKTRTHAFFSAYAAVMILVYPIGIPVLYSVVLWKHRELLNPRICYAGDGKPEANDTNEEPTREHLARRDGIQSATLLTSLNVQPLEELSLRELEERVEARREHPELVPFMFLWKDFDPDLYYYEVIECGRRVFLTDLLIVIAPHSATQAAVGCAFAFVSLLGFELMRPHLDPADSWLYRLGCVLIVLSSFLAVLIKADVAGETSRSAFGGGLVAVNLMLILAVLWAVWFTMRHMGDDFNDEENSAAVVPKPELRS